MAAAGGGAGRGAAAGGGRGGGGSGPSEEEGMVRSHGIEQRLTGGDGLRWPAERGEEGVVELGFGREGETVRLNGRERR
jgi:hypothetical protein